MRFDRLAASTALPSRTPPDRKQDTRTLVVGTGNGASITRTSIHVLALRTPSPSESSQADWSGPFPFWSFSQPFAFSDYPPDWHGPTGSGLSPSTSSSTATTTVTRTSSSPTSLATSAPITPSFPISNPTTSSSTNPSPSTVMKHSNPNLAAIIGGTVAGGVLLLLLAGIVLCLYRQLRTNRTNTNDATLINTVRQYPFITPMAQGDRKRGSDHEREERAVHATPEIAMDRSVTQAASAGQTTVEVQGSQDASGHSRRLDTATALAMFRQLERFTRTLDGDRREAELETVDSRSSDSPPQYDSIA